MSRKQIITSVSILTVIILVSVGVFAYTNIAEKPAVTVDQTPLASIDQSKEPQPDKVLGTGTFTDGDAVHKGSGTAKVIQTSTGPILKFENFSTTIGPDLFVYLSPNKPGEPLGAFASLGKLKSNTGDQSYILPANLKDYKSVVVWCRAFSVTFTAAELQYL